MGVATGEESNVALMEDVPVGKQVWTSLHLMSIF